MQQASRPCTITQAHMAVLVKYPPDGVCVAEEKLVQGSLCFPAWLRPHPPTQTQDGIGVITPASATDINFPLKALTILSSKVYIYKSGLCSTPSRETPRCTVEGHCTFSAQARIIEMPSFSIIRWQWGAALLQSNLWDSGYGLPTFMST